MISLAFYLILKIQRFGEKRLACYFGTLSSRVHILIEQTHESEWLLFTLRCGNTYRIYSNQTGGLPLPQSTSMLNTGLVALREDSLSQNVASFTQRS